MGADDIINLFVIMAVGVIIADMLVPGNFEGTKALWNGIGTFWQISVNSLLGQPTKATQPIIP